MIGDALYELKGGQFVNPDGTWKNPYDRSQDALYEAKRRCCLAHGVKILSRTGTGNTCATANAGSG